MSRRTAPVFVIPIVIVTIITLGIWYVGTALMIILGAAAVAAYVAWLFTTFRRPADPARILPIYLLGVFAQLVHETEEWVMGFPMHFAFLFHYPHFTSSFFVVTFLLVGSGIWVLAGLGLYLRNPVANFLVMFFAFGPGLVNGVAHFVFPLLAHTFYFPGLVTVLFPTVVSVFIIRRLFEDAHVPALLAAKPSPSA